MTVDQAAELTRNAVALVLMLGAPDHADGDRRRAGDQHSAGGHAAAGPNVELRAEDHRHGPGGLGALALDDASHGRIRDRNLQQHPVSTVAGRSAKTADGLGAGSPDFAPIHDQALRLVMQGALTQFYAFTLVLVRLSGLMMVGPIFGQRLVPGNLRVLLILTLAFLITPAVYDHSRLLFDKLDSNHDGRLTADEVPESLRGRYETSAARRRQR